MKFFTTLAVLVASTAVANAQGNYTFSVGTGSPSTSTTTTYSPSETLSTTYVYPVGPTGTGGGSSPSGSAPGFPYNGTNPGGPIGSVGPTGVPTKTPVGPSTTSSGVAEFTGAANSHQVQAFSGLAAVGLAVAYFL